MGLSQGVLETLNPEARAYISELEARNYQLQEELQLLVYKRFSRSSEEINLDQGELFAEAEAGSQDPERKRKTVTVRSHTRKKAGRKPLDEKLPRVQIFHDIDEEDKQCGCGLQLVRIGQEIRERLAVIPEQFWVEQHIYAKYGCECEGSGDEDRPAVRIAPTEPSMIPGSIITAGLLAFILVNKFCDHLPFYRQEARFERLGIHISRQDMSNWTIAAAKRLQPLMRLMREEIRNGPIIQMDETPVQVLREPGRSNITKSYMWLARGGPPQTPYLLYNYRPTRSASFPREFLHDYSGHLQTDGYDRYDVVAAEEPGIVHVGCWAHVRRKFFEASKATKGTGAAEQALSFIQELYGAESELRDQHEDNLELFAAERRKRITPVLARFKDWLTKKGETVVPSSLLGKAIGYAHSQWPKLVRYLDSPHLTPDTNLTENAIRPFVVGRNYAEYGIMLS